MKCLCFQIFPARDSEGEVKQYTFSGDLKKYDDFDKIIRMLEEVSGIKISIKENCVVIGTK